MWISWMKEEFAGDKRWRKGWGEAKFSFLGAYIFILKQISSERSSFFYRQNLHGFIRVLFAI